MNKEYQYIYAHMRKKLAISPMCQIILTSMLAWQIFFRMHFCKLPSTHSTATVTKCNLDEVHERERETLPNLQRFFAHARASQRKRKRSLFVHQKDLTITTYYHNEEESVNCFWKEEEGKIKRDGCLLKGMGESRNYDRPSSLLF